MRVLVVITLLMIPYLASSQSNFVPAKVVLSTGQEKEGFIDFRDWRENPESMRFKETMSSSEELITPLLAKRIEVAGQIYRGEIVDREISPREVDEIDFDEKLKIAKDTVFLQAIYEGEKSLYYLLDKNGVSHFYIGKGLDLELLQYKAYLIRTPDTAPVVTENKRYMAQLALYLNQCTTITSQVRRTQYGLNSIQRLFQYYIKCSGQKFDYERGKDQAEVKFGVIAGITQSKIDFTGGGVFEYLTVPEAPSSITPTMGGNVSLILPRNQGRWRFNNEIIYSAYSTETYYEDYTDENQWINTNTEIEYQYIRLNTLFRYIVFDKNFQIYLNGGISNGIAIKEHNYKFQVRKFFTELRETEDQAVPEARTYEQSFVAGLGMFFNKISGEVRVESGTGMSTITTLGSKVKRIHFLIGYRF